MNRSLQRRSLLAGLGTGFVSALAGCSALGNTDESGPEPYRIGGISLINVDDRSHTLDLRIERDGEVVLEETYELAASAPGEGTVTEVSSVSFGGCTAGLYGITVKLDDMDGKRLEETEEGQVKTNAWRTLVVEDDGPLRWAIATISDDEKNCTTPTPPE